MTGKSFIAVGLVLAASLYTQAASADRPARRRPTQVVPTGAEDAKKAITPTDAEGEANLDAMTNRSTAGLKAVERADGTVSIDLQGRFKNVMVAKPGADGRLTTTCNTGAEAKKEISKAAARSRIKPVIVKRRKPAEER